MISDWTTRTLGELTEFKSGKTPSKSNPEFWEGHIPWISASSMHGNRYSYSKLRITDAAIKAGSIILDGNTILLLVRGSTLHNHIPVGITTAKVTFNQDVKAIIPKDESVSPWFLLYWLMSKENELLGMVENTGIGAGKLDTKVLKKLEIRIPTKHDQSKLIAFFKSIDDKIHLNHQINQTLESIVQTIFKSWFVDFDPVKAKMEGCEPEGMDAETAAVFPDKLVDSELGMIPERWKVKPISGVTTVGIGKTPPRKEPKWFSKNSNDVTWVSIKDMGKSGTYILESREQITDEARVKFNVKTVPKNSVILSFKLTIGRVAVASHDLSTNEAIAHFVLPETSTLSNEYLYLYLKQFDYSTLGSTSSIAYAINSKIVKTIPLLLPDDPILNRFQEIISPVFEMIKNNQKESASLIWRGSRLT